VRVEWWDRVREVGGGGEGGGEHMWLEMEGREGGGMVYICMFYVAGEVQKAVVERGMCMGAMGEEIQRYREQGDVVLMGDLNVDLRRSETSEQRILTEEWEEWAEENEVVFLNIERGYGGVATRMGEGRQRDSMLDYVIVSKESEVRMEDMVIETEIGIGETDHRAVGVTVRMEAGKRGKKRVETIKWWKWREKTDWRTYEDKMETRMEQWREWGRGDEERG
jgi:exonuclease III